MEETQNYNESILQPLLEECASEFEKEVLYEIYKKGLVLPDEVNKTIFDKNIPIAQADFFFTKKNIVLFVDGEPHNASQQYFRDVFCRSQSILF